MIYHKFYFEFYFILQSFQTQTLPPLPRASYHKKGERKFTPTTRKISKAKARTSHRLTRILTPTKKTPKRKKLVKRVKNKSF